MGEITQGPQGTNQPQTIDDLSELKSTRQPTFGEQLVGLSFNTSGNADVNRANQLCAELADLVNHNNRQQETTQLYNQLYSHTIGEILNAQMNVVKLLTLKY